MAIKLLPPTINISIKPGKKKSLKGVVFKIVVDIPRYPPSGSVISNNPVIVAVNATNKRSTNNVVRIFSF
jgi:hypothetical protein